jgi:hypothetical protein
MRWEFVFSLQKTAESERFTASEERAAASISKDGRELRVPATDFGFTRDRH